MDQSSKYSINTLCVQGGYTPGNGEPRQIPIIQSTTFKYATSEDMGKLFDLASCLTCRPAVIFIPACKTPPAIPSPPRLPNWRAAPPVC